MLAAWGRCATYEPERLFRSGRSHEAVQGVARIAVIPRDHAVGIDGHGAGPGRTRRIEQGAGALPVREIVELEREAVQLSVLSDIAAGHDTVPVDPVPISRTRLVG